MKVCVTVKRVLDPYVSTRVKPDGLGIETHGLKHTMNPMDAVALEQAIRLREQGFVSDVLVVSIGSQICQETLRYALALGADRALLVVTEETLCSLSIAKIIKALVQKEDIHLVLMGKQACDDDNHQTPQMLAALLSWPQAIGISKMTWTKDGAEVGREVEHGFETLHVTWPAVVSTDLTLNEPRYVQLPHLMKAKQKPLQMLDLESLSVSLKTHVHVVRVTKPSLKRDCLILNSVDELLYKLRTEECGKFL